MTTELFIILLFLYYVIATTSGSEVQKFYWHTQCIFNRPDTIPLAPGIFPETSNSLASNGRKIGISGVSSLNLE